MVYSRAERSGSFAGVAAVVLWIVGSVFMFVLPTGLADDAGNDQILAWIKHNSTDVMLGGWIFMVGCLCFLWFLGVLRSRLVVSEGGPGTLSSIAYTGGVAGGLFALLLPAADVAAASNKSDITASTAGALHHASDMFFIASELSLIILLVAVGVLGFATRVVPRWFAVVGLVLALALLIGPIGWAALLFGVPLWTLCTSGLLLRSTGRRRPRTTASALGATSSL